MFIVPKIITARNPTCNSLKKGDSERRPVKLIGRRPLKLIERRPMKVVERRHRMASSNIPFGLLSQKELLDSKNSTSGYMHLFKKNRWSKQNSRRSSPLREDWVNPLTVDSQAQGRQEHQEHRTVSTWWQHFQLWQAPINFSRFCATLRLSVSVNNSSARLLPGHLLTWRSMSEAYAEPVPFIMDPTISTIASFPRAWRHAATISSRRNLLDHGKCKGDIKDFEQIDASVPAGFVWRKAILAFAGRLSHLLQTSSDNVVKIWRFCTSSSTLVNLPLAEKNVKLCFWSLHGHSDKPTANAPTMAEQRARPRCLALIGHHRAGSTIVDCLILNVGPQHPTTSHNIPQHPTTSHNIPQHPTTL